MILTRKINFNSQQKAIFRIWPKGFKQDIFFKTYFPFAAESLPIFSTYFNNLKYTGRISRFRAVVVRSRQYGYLSDHAIEAFRKVISPYFRKKTHSKATFLIHIYPFVPLTKKPAEVRIGGGKGSKFRGYFSAIKPGQLLFTIFILNPAFSKKLFLYASKKLGLKVNIFKILYFNAHC